MSLHVGAAGYSGYPGYPHYPYAAQPAASMGQPYYPAATSPAVAPPQVQHSEPPCFSCTNQQSIVCSMQSSCPQISNQPTHNLMGHTQSLVHCIRTHIFLHLSGLCSSSPSTALTPSLHAPPVQCRVCSMLLQQPTHVLLGHTWYCLVICSHK